MHHLTGHRLRGLALLALPLVLLDVRPARAGIDNSTVDIDVLFVIDNSTSMQEEQESLRTNFPLFIEALKGSDGKLPNLHVGIVSTDLGAGIGIQDCNGDGDAGRLQNTPIDGTCEGPSDSFIQDVADPGDPDLRITNYTSSQTLEETFSCIAELGTRGCGFEQPLESMYRALRDDPGTNAGFLRDDALLVVVIIADEDDCSTEDPVMFSMPQAELDSPLGPLDSFRCFEFGVVCDDDRPRDLGSRQTCRPREDSPYMYPIERYVQFFQTDLGKDPDEVLIVTITGGPEPVVVEEGVIASRPLFVLGPSCSGPGGIAQPAVRLDHFASRFPFFRTSSSICDEGLTDGLVDASSAIIRRLLCGDGMVDADLEECDGGGTESATCNADCTMARCGDGIVNTAAGEQCEPDGTGDSGTNGTCTSRCTLLQLRYSGGGCTAVRSWPVVGSSFLLLLCVLTLVRRRRRGRRYNRP